MFIGAISVPLFDTLTVENVENCIRLSQSSYVLFSETYLENAKLVKHDIPDLKYICFD